MKYIPVVSVVLSLLLGGCASQTVTSHVTTFHTLPAAASVGVNPIAGRSVFVKPGEGILPGPEFSNYASIALGQFTQKGFTMAASESTADYLAYLSYSTDDGRTKIHTSPVYGQVGGTSRHPMYGFMGNDVHVQTIYARHAHVMLWERSSSTFIWEARNKSEGDCGEISAVLPRMIQAMVLNFPGNSGKTEVVKLPLP